MWPQMGRCVFTAKSAANDAIKASVSGTNCPLFRWLNKAYISLLPTQSLKSRRGLSTLTFHYDSFSSHTIGSAQNNPTVDGMTWLCTAHKRGSKSGGRGGTLSVWVKERSGSQHRLRGSTGTSSHPGLAASLSVDARKLCREQCFFS